MGGGGLVFEGGGGGVMISQYIWGFIHVMYQYLNI